MLSGKLTIFFKLKVVEKLSCFASFKHSSGVGCKKVHSEVNISSDNVQKGVLSVRLNSTMFTTAVCKHITNLFGAASAFIIIAYVVDESQRSVGNLNDIRAMYIAMHLVTLLLCLATSW